VPALIPEDYLPDVHARLILYKRIAHAADAEELDALRVEIIDRFGPLPVETRSLFRITALKLRAGALGIDRVDLGPRGGRIEFGHDTTIDPIALVRMVQREPNVYRLEGGTKLRLSAALDDPERRFERVGEIFDRLTPEAPRVAATA
jgi:transcription-repair coupling factor (superfamily II helicase)